MVALAWRGPDTAPALPLFASIPRLPPTGIGIFCCSHLQSLRRLTTNSNLISVLTTARGGHRPRTPQGCPSWGTCYTRRSGSQGCRGDPNLFPDGRSHRRQNGVQDVVPSCCVSGLPAPGVTGGSASGSDIVRLTYRFKTESVTNSAREPRQQQFSLFGGTVLEANLLACLAELTWRPILRMCDPTSCLRTCLTWRPILRMCDPTSCLRTCLTWRPILRMCDLTSRLCTCTRICLRPPPVLTLFNVPLNIIKTTSVPMLKSTFQSTVASGKMPIWNSVGYRKSSCCIPTNLLLHLAASFRRFCLS